MLSSGNTVTTYFLNSAGLATSSKTKFLVNPNSLSFDETYTYNNEGYLISHREIFSQVYNGSVLKDTSFTNFTIQNGNVVARANPKSNYEEHFEYNSEEAKPNFAFAVTVSYAWPFLGKFSRNLVSVFKDEHGNVSGKYSYIFDSKGNIVTKKITAADNSVIETLQYGYQCK